MNKNLLIGAHTVNENNNIQLVYIMSKNATQTIVRTTTRGKLTIANHLIFTTFTQAAQYRDEQATTVSWWAD